MPTAGERVRVYCRVRPGSERTVCSATDPTTISLSADPTVQRAGEKSWDFDGAYAPSADQQQVYDEVGAPILESVLNGYNGTVLAYGQTGTGKTHTLLNTGQERSEAGLVPRLVAALFVAIKVDVRHVYKVKASFCQIYNEQIDDLLRPKNVNLRVKPRGTSHEVEGLSAIECKSPSDLLALFDQGRRQLVYAETKMNKHSSRSHAVLQLHVARRERVMNGNSAMGGGSMIATQTSGKLTVVDLAGSERVKKSGADEDASGRRMKEAININTSLLGLSNVMKALGTAASHVPYRDSKLTHMLSDALGGNCRTSLVVCVSPAASDASESTGTLEFGSRAMKVRTHAVVNSSEVALDAAALAADLSEALQLQAEGALTGQMLAMEAELRERQKALAELEELAAADRAKREGEMHKALESAQEGRAAAEEAAEAAEQLRADLEAAEREAGMSRARAADLEAQLSDEVTDREELEAALAVKARSAQAAEAAAEEAAAATAAALAAEAEAKAEAEAARAELAAFKREAAAALAAHNKEQTEGMRAAQADADAAVKDAQMAAAARLEDLRDEWQAEQRALLASLEEAEGEAARGATTLHRRLRVATGGLADKENELLNVRNELHAAKEELSDVREALADTRRDLGLAGEAAGEARAAHDAEVLGMRLQVESALEAQAAAVGTVEAAVTPLHELVEGLHVRLASEQSQSAGQITALKDAFSSLRSEYEKALGELQAGAAARASLQARCEEVEGMLADEERRHEELASSLHRELSARESELAAALDDSYDKSEKLETAAVEAAEAADTNASLLEDVAATSAARDKAEDTVREKEAALKAAAEERARLQAEMSTLDEIAKEELADMEASRLAEVKRLLEEAEGIEANLEAERARAAAEAEAYDAALAKANAQLDEAKESGARTRRELWQRLKRQAVLQGAAVRELQASLSATRAAQELAARDAASRSKSARDLLADRDAELEGMRTSLQASERSHAKALAASGVTALKHGRKGKPHPRHIRCSSLQGGRLEWGRPDEKGKGYEKGMALSEITSVQGGLASEIARRAGKGREERAEPLFLCVVSAARSLDLEFPSRAARDEWWRTMERWRAAMGAGGKAGGAPAVRALALPSLGENDGMSSAATTPRPENKQANGSGSPGSEIAPRTRISPSPIASEQPA